MTRVKGVATFSDHGYKEPRCVSCGRFLKIKIYKGETKIRQYVCDRCRTHIENKPSRIEERNGVKGIKVDFCLWSAIN